jgi:hypothetical protein
MAFPTATTEIRGGQTQFTVDGLVQVTVQEDGSVTIDLAGRRVEVERHMGEGRLIVRHSTEPAIAAAT